MSPYGDLQARFLGAKNALAAVISCQYGTDALFCNIAMASSNNQWILKTSGTFSKVFQIHGLFRGFK